MRVAYLENEPSVNRPKDGLYFDVTLFIRIPLAVIVAGLVLFWPQSKVED